jgi:hypothetical protein
VRGSCENGDEPSVLAPGVNLNVYHFLWLFSNPRICTNRIITPFSRQKILHGVRGRATATLGKVALSPPTKLRLMDSKAYSDA